MARPLQDEPAMAESTTLPLTFAASLKQTFRQFEVDMMPTEDPNRHAIRLVPHDGPALVVGWADAAARRAELPTLGYALTLSKAQIGRELRIPPVEYLRFLERATEIVRDFAIEVSVVTHAVSSPKGERTEAPSSDSAKPYWGIVVASASLLGAIAWLIAR